MLTQFYSCLDFMPMHAILFPLLLLLWYISLNNTPTHVWQYSIKGYMHAITIIIMKSLIVFQFECEFRRFSVDRTQTTAFEDFYALVKESHHLPSDMPFTISYTDPRNGDLLPITNNDNLRRAYSTAMPMLRLVIYRKQGKSVCTCVHVGVCVCVCVCWATI